MQLLFIGAVGSWNKKNYAGIAFFWKAPGRKVSYGKSRCAVWTYLYCSWAKTSAEMIGYFKKYNLWNAVLPEERACLEKQHKTEADNVPVTWRMENMNVLLRALGKFDTLYFPATQCDFSNYKDLPDLEVDPANWIARAKLRNTEDILNETDLIYRIHWATRDAGLKGKPMPAGLSEDIVMERHFALKWRTMYK